MYLRHIPHPLPPPNCRRVRKLLKIKEGILRFGATECRKVESQNKKAKRRDAECAEFENRTGSRMG